MVSKESTLTSINIELLNEIRTFVEQNKVDYPNISYFVNQACKEKLERLKLKAEEGKEVVKSEWR